MDGDIAPVDDARRALRAPRRAARARRGPRGARPRPDLDPTSTCCASARCSKTLGALGGFVAGPRAAHRAGREPGPLLHLHDRVDARRHRGRARRARRASGRAEGDALRRAAARATSTGCGPATRRRSCPFVLRRRAAPRSRRRRAARRRAARARDPAADGRAGHVAAARHAVGRAHRRPGRRGSPALLDELCPVP